jgi:nucleoside-diphosphate-sugar epimerase
MKVVIAGVTGVLGRRMVRQFIEKDHTVIGLARDEKGKKTIQNSGGEAVIGSIFDPDGLSEAVSEADVVIHAATAIPTKVSSNAADWEMNDRLRRQGTRALTETAARIGAKTYVQQSVVWVGRPADDSFFDENTKVEKPDELYRSAFDGERIALEAGEKYGFNVSVLRCGRFYAADATHTRTFAEGLLKRRLPLIGAGEAVSSNIHADDAASAFATAAEAGKTGLWHVTDDNPVTIKDMLLEFARKLEAPAPRRIPL